MVWIVVSIVVFIALSGLMAAVDAAVLSVTHPEIDELILHGRYGAHRLSEVKRELPRSLAVIVILTNLINVLGPILVSRQAFQEFGAQALLPLTITLTVGTIVFSEVIPKSLGSHYAPRLARWSAPVIHALIYALYPLCFALAWLSRVLARGRRKIGTEEQIRALVKLGRKAGHIESDEGRMIFRTFLLNDRTAEDIMTPLANVVSISASATISEAARIVRSDEYSRCPVFGKSPDDVQGVLIARDILSILADGKGDEPISSLLREPFVIDCETPADELLLQFRIRHQHLGIVLRNGQTLGIVTLEDVLEEIVGEIEDEKDVGPGP